MFIDNENVEEAKHRVSRTKYCLVYKIDNNSRLHRRMYVLYEWIFYVRLFSFLSKFVYKYNS